MMTQGSIEQQRGLNDASKSLRTSPTDNSLFSADDEQNAEDRPSRQYEVSSRNYLPHSTGSVKDLSEINERLMRSKWSMGRHTHLSGTRIRIFQMLYTTRAEMVSGTVTLVNFVLVMLETDMLAAKEHVPAWLKIVSALCLVFFFVELMLRLFVERRAAVGDWWNFLDALVVVSGIVNFAFDMADGDAMLMKGLRTLRCLRLVRILKAMSLVKEAAHLRSLVRSFGPCLKLLLWSGIIIFIVMTMWATLAVQMLQPHMDEVAKANVGAWGGCDRCARSFDSVMAANLTLFQTIIAGDSWGLVAIPVIEKYPWAAIIFVGSLFTIATGILNLVVAILVDAAAAARAGDIEMRALEAHQQENSEKHNLAKIFQQMDQDQNGGISFEELMDGSQRIAELSQMLKTMDIQGEELYQLFQILDDDRSGEVDPSEFIDKIYRLKCGDNKTAATFVKHYVLHLKKNQHEMLNNLAQLEERVQSNTKLLRKFARSSNRASETLSSSASQLMAAESVLAEADAFAKEDTYPLDNYESNEGAKNGISRRGSTSALDSVLNWGADCQPQVQSGGDFNPPIEGHNKPLRSPVAISWTPRKWTPRKPTKDPQLCTPRSPLGPLGLATPKHESLATPKQEGLATPK